MLVTSSTRNSYPAPLSHKIHPNMPNKHAQRTSGGRRVGLLQLPKESAPQPAKSSKKRNGDNGVDSGLKGKKRKIQVESSDDESLASPLALEQDPVPATIVGLDFDDSDDEEEEKLSPTFRAIMDLGSDVTKNREIGQRYTQIILAGLNILGSKKSL